MIWNYYLLFFFLFPFLSHILRLSAALSYFVASTHTYTGMRFIKKREKELIVSIIWYMYEREYNILSIWNQMIISFSFFLHYNLIKSNIVFCSLNNMSHTHTNTQKEKKPTCYFTDCKYSYIIYERWYNILSIQTKSTVYSRLSFSFLL